MSEPVDNRIVNLVSKMISEDPDILNENQVEMHEVEEARLGPGVYGHVIYKYEKSMLGNHSPATRLDPPEYPESEVKLVGVHIKHLYGENGQSIQPSSQQQLATWREAAENYFYETVKGDLEEQDTLNSDDYSEY